MSELNGKRKRVETVDLTADDADDTEDLDAPAKTPKATEHLICTDTATASRN